MTAKLIAQGVGAEFWLIGDQVYRCTVGSELDTDGLPMSRRWECSHAHWIHYRSIYDWVEDVPPATPRTPLKLSGNSIVIPINRETGEAEET